MRVLVTGGAGYIGSHTVLRLLAHGHDVEVVDSFDNAKPAVIPRLEALSGRSIPVHAFDLVDRARTDDLFARGAYDAVIHFAGLKAVGESVTRPIDYYDNNLNSTLSILRAMDRHGVRRLVFSSSATVYGDQPVVPFQEKFPTSGTSPYGWTKVMIEQILHDLGAAEPSWRIALLRYFNPVGAHRSGQIGEDPQGIPNNLLPFIAQVAVGRREELAVFGGDYDTPDGTCRRDYIHVVDLAEGHVAALDRIVTTSVPVSVWNLGTGQPTSSWRWSTPSSAPAAERSPTGSRPDAPATSPSRMPTRRGPTSSWAGEPSSPWTTCVRTPGVGRPPTPTATPTTITGHEHGTAPGPIAASAP